MSNSFSIYNGEFVLNDDLEFIVYSTISLDGGLDLKEGKIVLSSDNDLRRLHYFRSIVDAIMIGANTVLKDDPLLTVRYGYEREYQPYRIVVDARLKTSPSYRVYDTSLAPSILVTSVNNRDRDVINEFMEKGVEIVFLEEENGLLKLSDLRSYLSIKYGFRKILVEGGGYLIGMLLKMKLIDKLYVALSPMLLGLNKIDFVNVWLDKPIKLLFKSIYVDDYSGEVVLEYQPIYQ